MDNASGFVVAAPSLEEAISACENEGPFFLQNANFRNVAKEDIIHLKDLLRSNFKDESQQNSARELKRIVEKVIFDTPGFDIQSLLFRVIGSHATDRISASEAWRVLYVRVEVSEKERRRVVYYRPSTPSHFDHMALVTAINSAF